jgi:hypothetical protein
MDPLPLVAHTSGPPPPIVPCTLRFDTRPCTDGPSTLTEPERLLASTVTGESAAIAISMLPEPVGNSPREVESDSNCHIAADDDSTGRADTDLDLPAT